MRAAIREMIAARSGSSSEPQLVAIGEVYFTPEELGARLKLHPDTIKDLFKNETKGIIRLENKISNQYKRRYVTERYSATAVERLERRLLSGDDPRYSKN
jgi:hypothetical protein